jgi:hypothetical protein
MCAVSRLSGHRSGPRRARGIRHPSTRVLFLTVPVLLAGTRSLSDLQRWGSLHLEVLTALGLRRSPAAATLSRLLPTDAVAQVRASLLQFTQQPPSHRTIVLQDPSGRQQPQKGRGVVAVDDKASKAGVNSTCRTCLTQSRVALHPARSRAGAATCAPRKPG